MSARLLVGKDLHLSSKTFLQDLICSLQEHADKFFLENVATNSKYTYRDLHEKASGVSRAVQQLGLKEDDIVTLVSPSTAEAIIFIIGVWLSGAATACINIHLPNDEICNLLKTTKSKVVYIGEGLEEKIQKVIKDLQYSVTIVSPNGKLPIQDYFSWTSNADLVTHVEQPLGNEHMIAVFFTSGTTGQQKGVIIRDQYLKFSGYLFANILCGQRLLMSGPLFWISNPLSFSSSILKGFCLIQLNAPTLTQLLQTITNYKPSFWFGSTSVLLDMCKREDLKNYNTSSLLRVAIGGSVLLSDQKRMICQRLFGNRNIAHNIYGCTEVGLATFEKNEYTSSSPIYSALGQPMDGITIKIVDAKSGCLLGPLCPGEICVKSPAQMKRYLEREVTENELDKDGFWHMGDIGYYNEKEIIFYQSRAKEIMKYREYQIAPAELEVVIQTHPDILESAVAGKPSIECGDLPTAFVVLKPGSTVTEQELYDYVSERVIDQKKLRGGVYFVDSLPRNAIGKLQRQNLLALLSEK